MKKVLFLLLFVLVCQLLPAQINYDLMAPHPRLLLKHGEESSIIHSIDRNKEWKHKHELILNECENIMKIPPVRYKKQGIRLLAPGTILHRVFFLSYAYRLTGDKRYAQRALLEMETVCLFKDWNPSHFLDTAMMTMAVAIGYDWLQETITPQQHELFSKAIVELGLLPSKDRRYDGFTRRTNNWNQVCNSGMVFGALAVYDRHPELAREMIDRAIHTIGISMNEYAPDGVYPEGYSYWGYGTNYNVLMISALQSALQTDAGLTQAKGFLESAHFINYMLGTSGKVFNYGDAGEKPTSFAALYWFARQQNDSGLLWNEHVLAQKGNADQIWRRDAFLPFSLICAHQLKKASTAHPKEKCWIGHGRTPIMIVRTSWKKDKGCYLALKGSQAWMSHGHMDAGSFVFDALGERWACDLGGQSYYQLEKEGISLWSYHQKGDRWKVFRFNNAVHNTLNIKGELHQVKGFVDFVQTFTKGKELGGCMDLTPLYGQRVKKVHRKAVIVKEKELWIDDSITTADQPVTFEWVMCTPAFPIPTGPNTWDLSQQGKHVSMQVEAPKGFRIFVKDNVPPHTYDEPNNGTLRIVIEATVPAQTTEHIKVRLIPKK